MQGLWPLFNKKDVWKLLISRKVRTVEVVLVIIIVSHELCLVKGSFGGILLDGGILLGEKKWKHIAM